MKIVIVSTFRCGSLNIGDRLITRSTISALNMLFEEDIKSSTVFRADKWESVESIVLKSDFVIFACLAIRRNIEKTYRFLPELLKSGVPFGVLAAGTSLGVSSSSLSFERSFTDRDIKVLKDLTEKANFFSTRGALTYSACKFLGLEKSVLSGDIAFFDDRFKNRRFDAPVKIRKIAISDPHYVSVYEESFNYLVSRLRNIFPNVEIHLLLHGKNDEAVKLARKADVLVEQIYRDSENGLDKYDNYDLHVGYRVHGHVSMLVRRHPSYLLEQDGRGCDYGLTFHCKTSVPHYRVIKGDKYNQVSTTGIEILLAMIVSDYENGFSRFSSFNQQIYKFVSSNLELIRTISDSDSICKCIS
ncbi:polysaccharide pyruvyl transferase family protein [uncultured Microbulbifer sp.]|uniref:polysaccharide pyruvyl transferase family protein n=1 Tax=uncultured Microbulbifer sp. TaxID=348147 RepID=UPI00260BB05F|nr:polysaccharide pyruvyl transferase family protein [uncultured Microbulbifer sp.]